MHPSMLMENGCMNPFGLLGAACADVLQLLQRPHTRLEGPQANDEHKTPPNFKSLIKTDLWLHLKMHLVNLESGQYIPLHLGGKISMPYKNLSDST